MYYILAGNVHFLAGDYGLQPPLENIVNSSQRIGEIRKKRIDRLLHGNVSTYLYEQH
jgi:hypothetical protein